MSSLLTSLIFFVVGLSFASNFLPQTTSEITGNDAPRLDSLSIIFFAAGTRSSSYMELPTSKPIALIKVFAIPPPTIS